MFEPPMLPEVRSAEAPELLRTPPPRRWVGALAIGLAALLALSGVVAGGIVLSGLLTGNPADAARTGYAYVPASSTSVYEFRLDLPAGQREQLARFLTRFPGFDDEAQVESRLTEMLEDAISQGSNGELSWATDIEPWFGGWVISATSTSTSSMLSVAQGMLVVVSVTDRAAAEAALLKFRSSDMEWSSEDVNGVVVWSGMPDWYGEMPPVDVGEMPWLEDLADAGGQAYAVTHDALLFGMRDGDIRDALRVRAGDSPGLLGSTRFIDALRRAPAGRLGLAWVDIEGMGVASTLDRVLRSGPMGGLLGQACGDPTDSLPRDALVTLAVRDGRAVVDISATLAKAVEPGKLRESDLTRRVPADAFFYAEAHDVGDAVSSLLACLRDVGNDGGLLKEIEKTAGNLDELFGWATDVGLGLRYDGTRVSGGLLAKVNDQARAAEALGRLRALITAGGGQLGDVTVSEQEYRGVRLVTFALSGGSVEMPAPAPSPTLAYALVGDMVVIGVDDSFVRAVLDTEAATSLASADRFRRAVEFAGAQRNAGLVYVDMPTATELYHVLGRLLAGRDRDSEDYYEYAESIGDLLMFAGGEGSTATFRVVLSTNK